MSYIKIIVKPTELKKKKLQSINYENYKYHFFCISINHNHINHMTSKMVKKNNNKFIILFFHYFIFNIRKYIYNSTNVVFMNLNVLNFIHNLNPNNIIIFNTCGFHHCFFHEQNIILRHYILHDPFCLTTQNNPMVIDLRYLYGSTSESNHNRSIMSCS